MAKKKSKDQKFILKLNRVYESKLDITTDREKGDQFLAYSVRPFIMTPLPYKKFKGDFFEKRNGNFFLNIQSGKNKDGEVFPVPFGQDRLVANYVITKCKQQGKRKIVFETAREYFDLFSIPADGKQYRILIDRIKRLFYATYYWGFGEDGQESLNRFHFFDKADLWYHKKNADNKNLPGFENKILLSHNFYQEIQKHAIPIEIKVLAELKKSPIALDLYSWAVYRAYQLAEKKQGKLTLPLWGEKGFIAQTNLNYKRRRNNLRKLSESVELVEFYCPGLFEITKATLTLRPRQVINKRCLKPR